MSFVKSALKKLMGVNSAFDALMMLLAVVVGMTFAVIAPSYIDHFLIDLAPHTKQVMATFIIIMLIVSATHEIIYRVEWHVLSKKYSQPTPV